MTRGAGGEGKDTPNSGYKLVYNSVYGKLAKCGDPVYANLVHASLITSGCRTLILKCAIATHLELAAVAYATAIYGVYFLTRHEGLDSQLSDEMGDWVSG